MNCCLSIFTVTTLVEDYLATPCVGNFLIDWGDCDFHFFSRKPQTASLPLPDWTAAMPSLNG